MALSNYTNIASALGKWLNREGFSAVTDNAEDFIIMAQRRIQREVRIPPMESVTDLTVTGQTVSVPTDLLQVIDLVHIGTNRNTHLERQSWDYVASNTKTGNPCFFARAGSDFWFAPIPSGSETIKLFYYKELSFIDTSNATNWFSQYAPELILSAAQVEAMVYLKEDARVQVLNEKYEVEKMRLERQARVDDFSSNSRIRDEGIRLFGAP